MKSKFKHFNKLYKNGLNNLIYDLDINIKNRIPTSILAINGYKLYLFDKKPDFENTFFNSSIVIPDGQSIVWLVNLFLREKISLIAGVDLMQALLALGNQKSYRVFFLGSKQELLDILRKVLCKEYPSLIISGMQNGYYEIKTEHTIINDINNSESDILFVAFDSPRKEEFIIKYQDILKIPVMLSVGGSYEVVAHLKTRGNPTMQKLGFEWFFRMMQDPARLFSRYMNQNIYLIKYVLKLLMDK